MVHTGDMTSMASAGSADRTHPLLAVLDPALLEVLACPADHHAPLTLGEPGAPMALSLTCTDCGRVFAVRDGIPVLLLDEARLPDTASP